jgi:hypothetical protein
VVVEEVCALARHAPPIKLIASAVHAKEECRLKSGFTALSGYDAQVGFVRTSLWTVQVLSMVE